MTLFSSCTFSKCFPRAAIQLRWDMCTLKVLLRGQRESLGLLWDYYRNWGVHRTSSGKKKKSRTILYTKPVPFGYYKRHDVLLTKDILADVGQFQILFLLFACLWSARGLQLYKERKVMNHTRTCANNENPQWPVTCLAFGKSCNAVESDIGCPLCRCTYSHKTELCFIGNWNGTEKSGAA